MLAILKESQIPQDDNVGGVIAVMLQKVAAFHFESSKMENKLDFKSQEHGVWRSLMTKSFEHDFMRSVVLIAADIFGRVVRTEICKHGV